MKALTRIHSIVLTITSRLQWLPPLLARIVVGSVFLESGWGKLHNLENVTGFFTQLGIPAPGAQALLVANTEFFCGLLLIAGLLTRYAAFPLICTMVIALITAKKDEIHAMRDLFGISEFLYIPLLVSLIIAGAGAVSLDRLARKKLTLK